MSQGPAPEVHRASGARRATTAALLYAALTMPTVARAASGAHDLSFGWGTGFDARLGKGAAYLGFGGGPAVLVPVGTPDEHWRWEARGELRWLTLAGTSWLGRGGLGLHRQSHGSWAPGGGVDATVYGGATLRAVTIEHPDLAPDVAPALQLRLQPLRFQADRLGADALRIELGSGWDRGRPALAVGVTLIEISQAL